VEIFPNEYEVLLQDRPGITDLATLTFRHEEQFFQAGPLENQYGLTDLAAEIEVVLEVFPGADILFRPWDPFSKQCWALSLRRPI